MSLKFNQKVHRYWMDGKPVSGATTLIGNGIPKPAQAFDFHGVFVYPFGD